jgi:hypothetical protein
MVFYTIIYGSHLNGLANNLTFVTTKTSIVFFAAVYLLGLYCFFFQTAVRRS